jgi:hypothetical protein
MAPVDVSVAVTFAFAMVAPVVSVTVPSRVALTACPKVKGDELRRRRRTSGMTLLRTIT